jgi:hypothetical protein
MIKFDVLHVLMTTLVVLQPEFGGALSRAAQRTMIAGLLLGGLHGTLILRR